MPRTNDLTYFVDQPKTPDREHITSTVKHLEEKEAEYVSVKVYVKICAFLVFQISISILFRLSILNVNVASCS